MLASSVDAQCQIMTEHSYSKLDPGHVAVDAKRLPKARATWPAGPIWVKDAGKRITQDGALQEVTNVITLLMTASHGAILVSAMNL